MGKKSDMIREELLDNLQKTSILIKETEKLVREAKKYTSNWINTFKRMPISFKIAFLYLLYKLTGYIVNSYNYLTGGLYERLISKMPEGWGYFFAVPLWYIYQLLLMWVVLNLLCHLHRLLKIKIYHKRLEEIEKKVKQNIDILNKRSVLPKLYWYSVAVDKIIEYLSNRRSDDLKEAINVGV